MPPLARQLDYISVENYLAGERESEQNTSTSMERCAQWQGRHNHNRIAGNLYALIWSHQRGKPCEPMTSDMLVKTTAQRFRYPRLNGGM